MKLTRLLVYLLAVVLAVIPVYGDESDETLKYFLSKSDLVVVGVISSVPVGVIDSAGVVNYSANFKVGDVLKGDDNLKGGTIKVDLVRFEREKKDKHPLIKKDGECILFLKNATPNIPSWKTADFWFGVQYASPRMASSIKRLGKAL